MGEVISSAGDLRTAEPSLRKLREFGLLVGCILAILGTIALPRVDGYIGLALGAVLIVAGLARPSALRHAYRWWMKVAEILNAVVSPVILGIVFFGVIMPMGIFRRLLGKDEFFRNVRKQSTSWEPYASRQQRTDHFKKMY